MPVIVVSNRVVQPSAHGAMPGGLASALLAAVQRSGATWIGGSGVFRESETTMSRLTVKPLGAGRLATVDFPEEEYGRFYNGMANSALWPILHYRTDLLRYDRTYFESYRTINRLMAEGIASAATPDSTIWIHDYHYFMVASYLRRLGVNCPLGFFLHTPFPARSLMTCLPEHRSVLAGLLDYDLIGFQTHEDLRRFTDYAVGELGVEQRGEMALVHGDRHIRVGVFPIGIDVKRFIEAAAYSPAPAGMQPTFAPSKRVIGVDRLDYSKGLVQRLDAYKHLLIAHPELRSHVSFLQITPPTREDIPAYRELRTRLATEVGEFNGRFGDISFAPMHYLNEGFSPEALSTFYRYSEVGCVTPLRDGMNLVAKEYVAAQDPENPGVLVLSKFAGAAQELSTAVLVNPYDVEEMSWALYRALNMPRAERIERWQLMMRAVRATDVSTWFDSFIEALRGRVRKPNLVPVRSVA